MAIEFIWTGKDHFERIAEIRWQCYGSRVDEKPKFLHATQSRAVADDDILIATDHGTDVGTATSLSFFMHIRGKRVPCQGVAWVGTSKSNRRRIGNDPGIASQIMQQMLKKGQSRSQVVSALMPFRVSFYEHFGYGIVERQNIWSIPVSILPAGSSLEWRFGSNEDLPAMLKCRALQANHGHCDIETDAAQLQNWWRKLEPCSQFYVGQRDGVIASYAWIQTISESDRIIAQVTQPSWSSASGLRGILELLCSLKDQYSTARITLPTDIPVNWLLKEKQLPHRLVEHPVAFCKQISRMQLRVLDHPGFMNGQELSRAINGQVIIGIRESEQNLSTLQLTIEDGIISADYVNAQPDIIVSDMIWASISCGELRASTAVELGLTRCREDKLALLDALADGPAPFCFEYF